MSYLRKAGEWVWAFIVGDNWRLAAGAVFAIAVTAALAAAGLNPWWLVPLAIPLILVWSIARRS